jgi:hypothetical protein
LAGFKKKGFFYKVDDLLNNSIRLDEIISDQNYSETIKYIYNEPISQQAGKCFSYHEDKEFKLSSGYSLFFKMNHDFKIYIHKKGDEFWLSGYQIFPMNTAFVTLEVNRKKNWSLGQASFREIRSVLHSKDDLPCINYAKDPNNEHALFVNCCKQQLWNNLPSEIKCRVADMNHIFPVNATMPECDNEKAATAVYWNYSNYLNDFVIRPWKYDCPVPCTQTWYKVTLEYYHENNVLMPEAIDKLSEGHFTFIPYYSTFTIEEEIEKLEYDIGSLLVSAGGNLGLFLGFSCLSVLFFVIEWLQRFWKK